MCIYIYICVCVCVCVCIIYNNTHRNKCSNEPLPAGIWRCALRAAGGAAEAALHGKFIDISTPNLHMSDYEASRVVGGFSPCTMSKKEKKSLKVPCAPN